MNYLAHLYLSPDNDEIRIGCFIADSVKGSNIKTYSEKIQEGIILHRAIDTFTDTHPVIKECVLKIRPYFRLYSSVVIDIYFDHFLASYWELYSNEKLDAFVEHNYKLIEDNMHLLSSKVKYVFSFMKEQNWLGNYNDLDFLVRVFTGMSKRTPYFSNMETAVDVLKANYSFFEKKFFDFFPDVCTTFKALETNYG